ncbi:hypothetical protein EDD18DRAFT_1108194 [Armillaria luteobubalina]|uniref:Uncharacterized protein n=1 Tax=Armillaria luteobubalina TaxID=153913 RepID=A0AA39Q1B1_9AGAR|nr:hypothetical protein EDD18DRAFT_1108194 [Armillaria luteobubalina]
MPEQHAHVLYTKLLLSQGHGYPLWIPEPDYSLPSAFFEKGICVGDVGIIRNDGGFDFIFNVFLEADHPWLWARRPKYRGGAQFEFSTSKDEAAILVLPQGATRFDRKNLSSMRNYAVEHAHEWYKYINGPNCFVTGCDETIVWGSAAMSKPSGIHQFSITFVVGGLAEGRIALRSSWSTNQWANSRVYPQDIETVDPPPAENQAVFIRGFTISVREKSWVNRMLPDWLRQRVSELSVKSGNMPVIGTKVPYSDQGDDSPPISAPVWASNGSTICGSIVGNELTQLQISIIEAHMQSSNESHQPEYMSDNPLMSSVSCGEINIPVAGQSSGHEHDDVVLHDFPERSVEVGVTFPTHNVPESDVVVTHDSVWMSSMLEESLDDSAHPGISNQEMSVEDSVPPMLVSSHMLSTSSPHQSPSDDGDKSTMPTTGRQRTFYRTSLDNICNQAGWHLTFDDNFSGPQHNGIWTTSAYVIVKLVVSCMVKGVGNYPYC